FIGRGSLGLLTRDRYLAFVTSSFALRVCPSCAMLTSPVIRSAFATRSNLIVRPSSSINNMILSPSIFPLVMTCCSPSSGPAVPVISEPFCVSVRNAEPDSSSGSTTLKVPVHLPVIFVSAAVTRASAPSSRMQRIVFMEVPSREVVRLAQRKVHKDFDGWTELALSDLAQRVHGAVRPDPRPHQPVPRFPFGYHRIGQLPRSYYVS